MALSALQLFFNKPINIHKCMLIKYSAIELYPSAIMIILYMSLTIDLIMLLIFWNLLKGIMTSKEIISF